MINRLLSNAFFAVTWTILLQVLLCIPGDDLPDAGLMDKLNLDKVVHVILFGGLTGLWCYYYYLRGKLPARLTVLFFIIFLLSGANGIIMEYVQRDFIPHRSFDQGDIIADLLGSSIAYGICNIKLLKTTV